MRHLLLGLLLLGLVSTGCNKASNADVDKGITLWNEIWEGYFKSLEDNAADPDKMVEAGQKYIDDNKDKIAQTHKIFSMRGTQAQIDKVKAAVDDGMSKMTERLGALGQGLATTLLAKEGMTQDQMMAKVQEIAGKIQEQATDLVAKISG